MEYDNVYEIQLHVGLSDRHGQGLSFDRFEQLRNACRAAISIFSGGHNETMTEGYWNGFREQSVKMSVYVTDTDSDSLTPLIEQLDRQLAVAAAEADQDSILRIVIMHYANMVFVSGQKQANSEVLQSATP